MDKKTIILIIALGILVIFWIPIMTWLGVINPRQQQPAEQKQTETVQPQKRPDSVTETAEYDRDTSAISPTPGQPTEISETDTATFIPEDSIVIETNNFEITLTNHGGGPVSFKLKNYLYANGEPIQMLPNCEQATPRLNFNNRSYPANKFVYESSVKPGRYSITSGEYEVAYTYTNSDGGQLIKRYRFNPDKYDYELIVEMENREALGFEREYLLEWQNPLEPTEINLEDDYNNMWAMALMGDERIKFDDYTNNMFKVSQTGVTNWIASRSKYFTVILMPDGEAGTGAVAEGYKEKILVEGENITARRLSIGVMMELPYEARVADSFTVYVGPADYEILAEYNNKTDDIVDIGTTPYVGWIIKIFAVPIMWLLPRMYNIIPNYGLVIILFALLVKLITWPLTKKAVQSMSAMRELQPKMEELKKKHKNNPQALQRETMKMYKEMGVNPLSGCLPYLPQMPLFFALFAVFRSTILLRQASFILWWDDLSRGALSVTDPYIILVILMVVLMFLQQKMTMTDPKNKALMYIFPLMLGFLFYRASAGLVLYWTCFSLFSFLEQIIFRRPSPKKTEVATE